MRCATKCKYCSRVACELQLKRESFGLTKHENHLRGWIILALAANCKYIQHSFSQNFNDLFAKKMIFNTFSMSKWTIGATNILYQNHKMLTFISISVDLICVFWFNNNNLRYLISTIQCTLLNLEIAFNRWKIVFSL